MLNVGRFTHFVLLVSLTVLLSACKDAAISFSSLGGAKKSSGDTVITTSFSMSSPNASSISNDFTPLVTGTYPTNGHSVYFFKDGACGTSIGSAALVSSNAFSANALAFNGGGLDDGVRTIYYRAHDGVSYITACASTGLSYSLDTTPPTISVSAAPLYISAVNVGSYGPINGNCSENGQTVSLKLNGTPVGSTSCSTGIYSFSSVNAASISDGAVNITAEIQDVAGNLTASSAYSVTKDTVAPTVSITNPVNNTYVNISNQSTFAISGSCASGVGNVTLKVDGGAIGTASCASTYSYSANMTAYSQGNHTLTAEYSDTAGNTGVSGSITVIKDTLPPTISVTSVPPYINISNAGSFGPVSGNCSESGQTVTVKFNGNVMGTTACSAINNFTVSPTFPSGLSDGTISVTAEISDVANNLTISSAYNITKDTVAPTVSYSVPSGGAYINSSNQNSFAMSGTCSGGTGSVTVKLDGTVVTTIACSTGFSGTGNFTSFSEGSHNLTAEYSDAAGNTGVSASVNVIKDTIAPNLTGSWTSPSGSVNDVTTPTFSNSLNEAGNVQLYTSVDTGCVTPISNTASTGGGSFNVNITTALAGEGLKNFNYRATDTAGNASGCNSVSFGTGYYLLTTPVLTGLTQRIINGDFTGTHNHLVSGDVYTVNVNNATTGNDQYMTYNCTFDRVVDGAVVGGNDCSFLPSGGYSPATYNSSTGTLTWNVGYDAFGPYEIKFIGTRTAGTPLSNTSIAVLDVVTGIATTNLVGYYDAMFGSTTGGARTNADAQKTNFTDLKSVNLTNYMVATIASWGTYGWQGSLPLSQMAERSAPHNISLGGTSDKVNFGLGYNSYSDVTFDFWFHRNGSVPMLGKPLLSNAQGSVGMSVFENPINDGTIAVKMSSAPSYPEQLTTYTTSNLKFLAQLNEPAAKPIKVKTYSAGIVDAAYTGTPTGTIAYGVSGPITNGTNTAVSLSGSSYIDFGAQALGQGSQYTVCAWFKTSASGVAQTIVSSSNSGTTGDATSSFYLGISSANKLEFKSKNCTTALSAASVNDSAWHFACGTQGASTITSYLDGSVAGSNACTGYTGAGSNPLKIGVNTNAGAPLNYFTGSIDEVFVMSTALIAGNITNLFASRSIPHCISKSHIYDSIWQYASVLVNDTSNWLQLSFGEQNECNIGIQASDHYTGSTNSLMLANDPATGTNGWTGRFGEVRMYSDANSSTPGTNFYATRNKYAMPPEVVGGLRAWYQNESLYSYANNAPINLWKDSSGNGYDLQQGTAFNQPAMNANILNSKPVAHFTGVSYLNQTLNPIVVNGSASATIFIVGKTTSTGTTFLGTNNPTPLSYYVDGVGNHKTFWGTVSAYADSGVAPASTFYITSINYDGTQATNGLKLRTFENAKLLTSSYAGTVPATLATSNGFTLGADYNGAGSALVGDIAEVIVFSTSLTAAKQQQVEEYLSRKFGIQLVQ